MNHIKPTYATFTLAALALLAGLAAPFEVSASLVLPKVPLFVNLSTTPNIFLEMDDSGSMDWDIMVPTYFTTCRYNNRLGCNTLDSTGEFYEWTGQQSHHNNIYETFEYIFASNDDAYNTACTNKDRDIIELCEQDHNDGHDAYNPWDWRVRSSALNVLYFNPASSYTPWPGYSNASFTSARSFPDPSRSSGYYDTRNLSGFTYYYWIDDKGFYGTQPDITDWTSGANDIVDQWDSNVRLWSLPPAAIPVP